ncbi:MAG: hypothetical protein WBX17_04015 [Microbacterium sp.]
MRQVDVTIDDRWFLPIPGDGDLGAWARESADRLLSQPSHEDDPAAVESALLGFAELADPTAVANLLFCPDGLPGRAIVMVYASQTDAKDLAEIVDEAPAALPRRVLPFRDQDAATARIVSTVRQIPDGVLGILQFQQLRDGALVETVVATPSLRDLGAGIELFEELTARVSIGADEHGQ